MKFSMICKAAVASAVVLGVTGVAGVAQAAKAPSEVTIGFLQRTLNAPYYVAMWAEAKRLAQEKGFKLVADQADGDPVKQMQQLEDMQARHVDAVVVNAVDPVTTKTAFADAVKKGLTVVFIDTEIPGIGAAGAFGADNEKIGELAGQDAARRLGPGAIKMGILAGAPGDKFVGPAREKGFLKGLTEGGAKYDIVIRGLAGYSQDKAVPATEDMLTAAPGLKLIFAYNDAMALGALSVVKGKGIDVVGIDGQKEAMAEIAKGCDSPYLATGLNSPMLAARDGFTLALDIAIGKTKKATNQPFMTTKAAGIDCRNVKDFYDPKSAF